MFGKIIAIVLVVALTISLFSVMVNADTPIKTFGNCFDELEFADNTFTFTYYKWLLIIVEITEFNSLNQVREIDFYAILLKNMYSGEYYDRETGRIYLRARFFDPRLGRFTQPDPHWGIHNMQFGDTR